MKWNRVVLGAIAGLMFTTGKAYAISTVVEVAASSAIAQSTEVVLIPGRQSLIEFRNGETIQYISLKNSSRVVLATDEDREGEFISWHLFDALNLKNIGVEVVRVTFTEITRKAVQTALDNPRQIDLNLVRAAMARSCLDKLVGFSLSPMLWRTGTGAKSAGRCQSAALHLLAERERVILNFKPQDYWLVRSHYVDGWVGKLVDSSHQEIRFLSEQEAANVVNATANVSHQVVNLEKKEVSKSPPAPFTTSTLQQAAGEKLNFTTKTTMNIAQKLYESGLITYMRTDSCSLSEEFCVYVKAYLQQNDSQNIPEVVTQHRNKNSAQEGHEAIRPTHIEDTPNRLSSSIDGKELQLYELIWNRSIASQCQPALIEQTRVKIVAGDYNFILKGNRIVQLGYAKYWNNLGEEKTLPEFSVGQDLELENIRLTQHQTEPPKRFTEPSLVKTLEKTGVGRPSTYANIINTLLDRVYVTLAKKNLMVTELGLQVDELLSKVVPDVINPGFTAQLEANLDEIAAGQLNWEKWLIDWNSQVFQPALNKGNQVIEQVISEQLTEFTCPVCGAKLERHQYTKNRELKMMLRCSQSRHPDCQDVTYFQANGVFWSPKFGELPGIELPQLSGVKSKPISKVSRSKRKKG